MPMMPRRPAWLPCLLLMWWLACPVQAQSSLPLPQESPAPMRCFTTLEWDVLQIQVDGIIDSTAREAAKAAVAPLLADLAGERARAAGWESQYRKAASDALQARGALSTAVQWAVAGWVGTAIAACVAVLAIVIR
jgi:hypothetical protein